MNFNDPHGLDACVVGVGEGAEVTECETEEITLPDGDSYSASEKAQEKRARIDDGIFRRLGVAVNAAIKALQGNSQCMKLLSGGMSFDPVQILNNLYYGRKPGFFSVGPIRNDNLNTVISATTTPVLFNPVSIRNGATQLQTSVVEIEINDLQGSFVNGSAADQEVTIVHELGHAIYDLYGPLGTNVLGNSYGIQPDGGNVSQSEANTDGVKKACL